MGRHKIQSDKAAGERFVKKYGMTRSAWAKFKKKEPQKAHELRMKIQKQFYGNRT